MIELSESYRADTISKYAISEQHFKEIQELTNKKAESIVLILTCKPDDGDDHFFRVYHSKVNQDGYLAGKCFVSINFKYNL